MIQDTFSIRQSHYKIGFGCGGINSTILNSLNGNDFGKSIESAIDFGAYILDTAENYGDGLSENLIGAIVKKKKSNVKIATKFSPENSRYQDIIKSAKNSLFRLKREFIDLYQLHWPNPNVPLEETFSGMLKLKQEGLVKNIGVCNFDVPMLENFYQLFPSESIATNQIEYNIMERYCESSIYDYCKKKQIQLISFSPLNQAKLSLSKQKRILLSEIALRNNLTKIQLVLNWLVVHRKTIPIPSSKNINHVAEIFNSINTVVPFKDLELIQTECRPEVIYVDTKIIQVVKDGKGNKSNVYLTLEEALRNRFNLVPSPIDFSKTLLLDRNIKPVKLRKTIHNKKSRKIKYDLIEGRLKFWGWQIAFGKNEPIPCIVMEDRSSSD